MNAIAPETPPDLTLEHRGRGKVDVLPKLTEAGARGVKAAAARFIVDFPQFENVEGVELYKELEKRGSLSDRDEFKKGGRVKAQGG